MGRHLSSDNYAGGEDRLLSGIDLTQEYIDYSIYLDADRIIWFYFPVEERSVTILCQKLLTLDLEKEAPIKLFICSTGGNDSDMWAATDMIRWIRSPVWTYAIGDCSSAATALFVSGIKRFIFPNCRMMLHKGRASTSGSPSDIEMYSKSYMKEYSMYLSLISETTGQEPEEIDKLLGKGDLYFSADEAVHFGLATSVIKGKRAPKELKINRRKTSGKKS